MFRDLTPVVRVSSVLFPADKVDLAGLGGSSASLRSADAGSSTSPSSTTTVENSDGWDVCATDTNDGYGRMFGCHELHQSSNQVVPAHRYSNRVLSLDDDDDIVEDSALADIESFLNNLEPM